MGEKKDRESHAEIFLSKATAQDVGDRPERGIRRDDIRVAHKPVVF